MSTGWDNATLKKLKNLVGKGLSTSEIGKRLGMSKNAVVGKLNRLGWNAKAGTVADKPIKPAATKAPAKKSVSKTTEEKAKKTAVPKQKTVKATAKKEKSATKTALNAISKATQEKTTPKEEKKPAKVAPVAETVDVIKESKSDAKNLAMHQRIIQHSLEMASLRPNQCRWPIGDPDSDKFHFCGETVFVGKPYCYEHCKQAYQFTPPKKK
ncbi:MAG: GcrA family cell cycle regulator [Alphaproteobacteria bacterium]|nr:GcrA family cell cycle regulator [Alphaproteobacteria bacterium]